MVRVPLFCFRSAVSHLSSPCLKMTGVLAAVAQLFNRLSTADAWPEGRDYTRYKNARSSRSRARTVTELYRPISILNLGQYSLYVLSTTRMVLSVLVCVMLTMTWYSYIDNTNQSKGVLSARDFGLLVGPVDMIKVDSVCCPQNCSHCRPPPSLVYSSASCSSVSLSSPTAFRAQSSLRLSTADVSRSSSPSPHGMTLSDGTSLMPLPDLDVVTGTIAQRRGIKQFPPMRPRNPSTASLPKSLSPRSPGTPDTATGFKQRVVGFIRFTPRLDMELLLETPTPRRYSEDPFGRNTPSFFDDDTVFDVPAIRQHPELNDLTIYDQLPLTTKGHYYTEKCPKHGKARLYIGVSDIGSPTRSDISSSSDTRSVRAHLRSASANSPLTSSRIPPLLSRTRSPSHTARPGTRPKSQFRTLQLPQKVAQQEIERAQAESILPPTTPQHRPLYLPQLIAQRASRLPAALITPSRSRTFPSGPWHGVRRGDAAEGATRQFTKDASKGADSQLDGIISLLGEVLRDSPDDSLIAASGSDATLVGTGPTPVLSSSESPSSSAGLCDSPKPMTDLVQVSPKMEDIFGLLTNTAVASQLSSESIGAFAL